MAGRLPVTRRIRGVTARRGEFEDLDGERESLETKDGDRESLETDHRIAGLRKTASFVQGSG